MQRDEWSRSFAVGHEVPLGPRGRIVFPAQRTEHFHEDDAALARDVGECVL